MERLVDDSRAGVGVHEHLYALFYLAVALRCEGSHHDTHGPRHVESHVGAAYSLARLAAEEVRVVLAPHETAGGLIDGGSEEATSELQSRPYLVCRLLL